ncbi:MAG: flagellar hook-associated protein FlgK [Pseudobutyrivibrio sp.]|nr:flagellar hook-associated protein FlgK [Pseudobutyrivibrio sp.]
MANSFGSLWVGASGLQSASNGLNTTANNLSNVNTKGYVREQVVYEDRNYSKFGTAAISDQRSGLGVDVGTIVHARDIFLDKAYRAESGRYSFYQASFDAVEEVETFLQESDGKRFQEAISDLYEAFAEFAKDPGDTVNQNLVLQKASLFLSRSEAVYKGLQDYQSIINTKIRNDVNRINEIGKEILDLNKQIQRIEANKIEKAMNLRDTRDLLVDELASLARVSYSESNDGVVKIQIEGVEFLDGAFFNPIGMERNKVTGFVTPYWPQLSDTDKGMYYKVFNLEKVSAENGSDIGEIKSLLMQRGDHIADYRDLENITDTQYKNGIGNSVMMSAEAELDSLVHNIVTTINNLYSPVASFSDVYKDVTLPEAPAEPIRYMMNGKEYTLNADTKVLDINNCDVGSDNKLPPRELFTRKATDRYIKVDVDGQEVWIYNEEDPELSESCYTSKSIIINAEMKEIESLLPYKKWNDLTQTDYGLGKRLEEVWAAENYKLNPADTTPCSFQSFYTKWVGEIGTVGSIYETTATSLEGTKNSIEASRQGVIGVSSDEELTSMIKYQQAYNASSRYINVVNEMIQHLLATLGT